MEIGLLNKVSLGRFSAGFRKDLNKVALRYFSNLSTGRLNVTTSLKLKAKKNVSLSLSKTLSFLTELVEKR